MAVDCVAVVVVYYYYYYYYYCVAAARLLVDELTVAKQLDIRRAKDREGALGTLRTGRGRSSFDSRRTAPSPEAGPASGSPC